MSSPAPAIASDRLTVASRIWEIDFLRGASIILMVGYHLAFDLSEMAGMKRILFLPIDLSAPAWIVLERFFAAVFVVLSGISGTLTRSNVRRGLRLLGVSVLVTAATYVFDPNSAIWFGILQCLAVSILVYGLVFQRTGPLADALAALAVFALSVLPPLLMRSAAIRFDWLLPFGVHSPAFASYDYFPLLPWFGFFLAGAALGKTAYASRRSLLPHPPRPSFVSFAGRHSLLIYVVHQPVILGVLYLLGMIR